MMMIVNLPTKKALKELIAVDPQSFVVVDPALMPEWREIPPSQHETGRKHCSNESPQKELVCRDYGKGRRNV